MHHTGVVRKRIMPVELDAEAEEARYDANFVDERGRRVGKLRGKAGRRALGLMRVQECAEAKEIRYVDTRILNILA